MLILRDFLASTRGFEPPTPRLGGECSILLSYVDICVAKGFPFGFTELCRRKDYINPFMPESQLFFIHAQGSYSLFMHRVLYSCTGFLFFIHAAILTYMIALPSYLCHHSIGWITLPCIHMTPLNLRPTAGSPTRSRSLMQTSM